MKDLSTIIILFPCNVLLQLYPFNITMLKKNCGTKKCHTDKPNIVIFSPSACSDISIFAFRSKGITPSRTISITDQSSSFAHAHSNANS